MTLNKEELKYKMFKAYKVILLYLELYLDCYALNIENL